MLYKEKRKQKSNNLPSILKFLTFLDKEKQGYNKNSYRRGTISQYLTIIFSYDFLLQTKYMRSSSVRRSPGATVW